jgi:hypothetical protein
MVWITQRVIEYIKASSDVTNLLGSANNIFVEGAPLRKDKYITVSANIGDDQNSIDVDIGRLDVTVNVSRKINNAHSVCLSIVGQVNDLLNKGEAGLSDDTYSILHFLRVDDSSLRVDDATGEFYYILTFEFILDRS